MFDDLDLMHCMLNFPEVDQEHPFALDFGTIANAQQNDDILQQQADLFPDRYPRTDIGEGRTIIRFKPTPECEQPKIYLPDNMVENVVAFYHAVLGHSGQERTLRGVQQHFTHPALGRIMKEHVQTCDACQKCKNVQASYGEPAARIADFVPWSDVAVDLIGPWTFRDRNGETHKFTALTMIDTVTNYVEIVRLDNKTAEHVAAQFENQWLSRYPRPNTVVFDPGTEFKGAFREMLTRFNIRPSPTTVKNPQANAICERLHLTVAEVLRTTIYANPPDGATSAVNIVNSA